jgi:hypothetical protein
MLKEEERKAHLATDWRMLYTIIKMRLGRAARTLFQSKFNTKKDYYKILAVSKSSSQD